MVRAQFKFENGTSVVRLVPENSRDKQLLNLLMHGGEVTKLEARVSAGPDGDVSITTSVAQAQEELVPYKGAGDKAVAADGTEVPHGRHK